MMDDEFKKMRAIQKAAEDLAKQYQIPSNDEILRLIGYQTDWQRQFESITAMSAVDQMSLRHLLPVMPEGEMRRLREALDPPPAIAQLMREIEEEATRSQRELRGLTEGVLSPAVLSGYNSLGSMLHDIGLQAAQMPSLTRVEFAAGVFAPVEQYGRFLQDTVGRLSAVDIDPSMSRALQGSILLAEDVLGINSDITALMDMTRLEPSAVSLISPASLVLPFVQREELVAARERLPSLEVVDLASHSPAHEVATGANRIVQAIVDVNTARKLKGKPETFTPTSRSMIAVRDLVILVAQNNASLGDVLDTLYFLLYEAAGDDHPRYLDSNGGELTDDECEIIWIIKHLRAYARHDLDHGKPGSVRKKWRDLGRDLQTLGFSSMPATEPEFRRLHARLVERAEKFMRMMLDRIQ